MWPALELTPITSRCLSVPARNLEKMLCKTRGPCLK